MGFLFRGWRSSAWLWRNAPMFIHHHWSFWQNLQTSQAVNLPKICDFLSRETEKLPTFTNQKQDHPNQPTNQPPSLFTVNQRPPGLIGGGHVMASGRRFWPQSSLIKNQKSERCLSTLSLYLVSTQHLSYDRVIQRIFRLPTFTNLRWTLRILDMEDKAIFIWPAWIRVWWIVDGHELVEIYWDLPPKWENFHINCFTIFLNHQQKQSGIMVFKIRGYSILLWFGKANKIREGKWWCQVLIFITAVPSHPTEPLRRHWWEHCS